MHDVILCVVLCMGWVMELLPMHTISEYLAHVRDGVALLIPLPHLMPLDFDDSKLCDEYICSAYSVQEVIGC